MSSKAYLTAFSKLYLAYVLLGITTPTNRIDGKFDGYWQTS